MKYIVSQVVKMTPVSLPPPYAGLPSESHELTALDAARTAADVSEHPPAPPRIKFVQAEPRCECCLVSPPLLILPEDLLPPA